VEIRPLDRLDATVRIPGSKSYTQRAMVIAALAEGQSILRDPLLSEDTRILAAALTGLGAGIQSEDTRMAVYGNNGELARPSREIHLGNNGTAMRLLTGIASLGEGPVVLTGDPRLRERPMKPLLEALTALGVDIRTDGNRGYPPVTIRGGRLRGGEVVLKNIESSQYVSAILIAAPFADKDTVITLEGRVPSLPYIALTLETMGAFGVDVAIDGTGRYVVQCGQHYRGREYRIEGDVSSASYFFLAAALTKGRVRVENINPETRQGDIAFLTLLEHLGCRVLRGENHIEIEGAELQGGEISFDLGSMPDMVPTLAALSALRPGRSVIRNVTHLRLKESNRLAAMVSELKKTGIAAEEIADGIAVTGGTPRGAAIETYNDHRIAMSFAVLGLVVPGMVIEGAECVGKSFPGFWNTLEELYGNTA
jgi:3-phosphoshikimate 1-carboxyvinyltransferase